MRYIWHHIDSIIKLYNGSIPLAHFLKNYFRQQPKLGSRDRKILAEMAYCWYRVSKSLPESLHFEEKIKASLFVCETSLPLVLSFLPEEWRVLQSLPLLERVKFLEEQYSFSVAQNFQPFPTLSFGITHKEWQMSILQQPRLFIRIRTNPDKARRVFKENNIDCKEIFSNCFSLPNGLQVEKFLSPKAFVVQDASSQKTAEYFQPKPNEKWWDCCSGAGGKSLLLKDMEPNVQLTVSDKRASILHNLQERFFLYGHQKPEQLEIDVSDKNALQQYLGRRQFDQIICDVPCSGSGTWARTPEQLYFFEENMVGLFSERQKRIAENALIYLKPGGRLIYITCSVFREENEAVVDFLLQQKSLQLEVKELINGVGIKADNMFVAVLRK